MLVSSILSHFGFLPTPAFLSSQLILTDTNHHDDTAWEKVNNETNPKAGDSLIVHCYVEEIVDDINISEYGMLKGQTMMFNAAAFLAVKYFCVVGASQYFMT